MNTKENVMYQIEWFDYDKREWQVYIGTQDQIKEFLLRHPEIKKVLR